MTKTGPFLCANCRVQLQVIGNPEEKIAGCPACGVSDTFENVAAEAGQHMISKLTDDLFARTRFNSPHFKVTATKGQEPTYRFIMGDEQG